MRSDGVEELMSGGVGGVEEEQGSDGGVSEEEERAMAE
jgi:hypothetical protein